MPINRSPNFGRNMLNFSNNYKGCGKNKKEEIRFISCYAYKI